MVENKNYDMNSYKINSNKIPNKQTIPTQKYTIIGTNNSSDINKKNLRDLDVHSELHGFLVGSYGMFQRDKF